VLDLGYEVLGPCASVGSALAEIGGRTPSIALLDINLDGEPAFPIADALAERRVPYAFVSGYILSDLPEKYRGAPLFTKPIDPDAVEAWLVSTLGGTA
jgi:DNA-binding response OmpR family regulator